VLILTIALVWAAEFINTALEAVVDLASPQQHPLAKVGKDVGAAAVLLASLAAILVGLLILGPPLLEKLKILSPDNPALFLPSCTFVIRSVLGVEIF